MNAPSESRSIIVSEDRCTCPDRTAVDDHERNASSFQHAFQPRPWQRRLERDIRTPCFQHAEYGHDAMQRIVENEANPYLRADAVRTEVVRQPVRPRVQFCVGQPVLIQQPAPIGRESPDL